jgi:polysaccharide deacetylase 2 family uncharacterized protein YibQ
MTPEDLDAPLRGGRQRGPRRPWTAAHIGLAIAGIAGIAFLGWVLLVDDPLGGEPSVTASIERRLAPPPGEKPPAPPPAETMRNGVPVLSPGDPMPASGPVIIRVPGAGGTTASGAPPEVVADLTESTKYGPLPRIGPDGRRPSEVYARPTAAAGKPQVAILVTGLGLAEGPTGEAIKKLPPGVTLGFSPYSTGLDRWLGEARSAGHETLLQVPLEPYDYPADDPGPQTLLTSLPAAANLDRLRWAMGRGAGYAGLATYMGAKFTASEEALAPVLTEVARRGLLVVDGTLGPKSLVARLGADIGLESARAEIVLDAAPDAARIDAELARLERAAVTNGKALAVASLAGLTTERIIEWAAGLEARGIALVPASAVAKPQAQPASPVVGAR